MLQLLLAFHSVETAKLYIFSWIPFPAPLSIDIFVMEPEHLYQQHFPLKVNPELHLNNISCVIL